MLCALHPSGKIFGIPYNAASVLIIDPVTKIADTSSIAGLTGSNRWNGGVLSPSGKIFGIPYASESVLIIDPVSKIADTSSIAGLTGTFKWYGGVLSRSLAFLTARNLC